jgi:hypothetical protein
MKKIFFFPVIVFFTIISCTSLDDTEIPKIFKKIFSEEFEGLPHNVTLVKENWVNFSEAGTKLWLSRTFDDNGYAQFSSYQSNELVNIGWLITPTINTINNRSISLSFSSAQNFVDSSENKLQVYVSNNFDGANVLAANWIELPATVALSSTPGYAMINSGKIDLSAYTGGNINIAFKVTGSGTNANLDGLFQVDNVKIIEN